MHASSMENMRRCLDMHPLPDRCKVIDLGAMNVNGSYKQLLAADVDYVGIDLEPGNNVDVVLSDVYHLPFDDNSVDVVLSGQMLEHCAHFWRVFSEIHRVLKPDGLAFLIAPSSGPVHRYPVDCYRFYPDAYQALADWSGLRLVQSWTDERGPWRDLVGIFQKGGQRQSVSAPRPARVAVNDRQEPNPDPATEVRRGARPYLEVLADLHTLVEPSTYFEIGVRRGHSLALARCRSLAIDPDPHPDFVADQPLVDFRRCTSDDFFFFHGKDVPPRSVDLAFLDGMHLAEYVFRDFMNVERLMKPDGVIVIDDVLPNHRVQAERARSSQVWTGDVWRFVDQLRVLRPDLKLTWLDTSPTGLLVVTRLDPGNQVLWNRYNAWMRQLADKVQAAVPPETLNRRRAVAPTLDTLRTLVAR